ncbi:Transposon Tf2-9 polyprotein [Labeo rohita]|uniref:Gypsy retrotransposon integrase-like protein 1 n=1 Tax=Labeo rohita TaxID=84645 RepID=A0ABQ8KZQ6_LABRO|nr:Transposon Tf2-9 polyprotein [Labeo rohita]
MYPKLSVLACFTGFMIPLVQGTLELLELTTSLELTTNRFWWPTLNKDVIQFVNQCPTCNIPKTSHQRPAGLLQPLPIPQRPWSHIAIDFLTDLPSSNNYTTILTVIDRFSKACRVIPLVKLPTAWETAEVMMNQVFRFFGIPDDIVSDRGLQFTSQVWQAFFQQISRKAKSGANSLPPDLLSPKPAGLEPENPPIYQLLIIGSAAAKKPGTRLMCTYDEPSAEPPNKQIATVVLILSTNPGDGYGSPPEIFGYAYPARSSVLELPTNYHISPTFHVSLLKPAGDPKGERNQDEVEANHAPPLIINSEEAYQVHEILDSRRRGQVIQYLIDWEGYGPEERSWVNSQDILDPALIEDHLERPDPADDLGTVMGFASGAARRGGGSVTSRTSVALSDHHQREPSPEIRT